MRIQPPKTKKKVFRNFKEVTKYVLGHVVVGGEKPIPVMEFFKEVILKEYPQPLEALYVFLGMWPWEFQSIVSEIFMKELRSCKAALH